MTDTFRRRCESALTHPATLAVLGVVLVNGLGYGALWPHQWAAGRLGDL